MGIEEPKQYTPEEMAELSKSRIISDARLVDGEHYGHKGATLGGGADVVYGSNGIEIRATEEQKRTAKEEMDRELLKGERALYVESFLQEHNVQRGDSLKLEFREGSFYAGVKNGKFQGFSKENGVLTLGVGGYERAFRHFSGTQWVSRDIDYDVTALVSISLESRKG